MPTLLELREQRANIWAQAQEFNSRHAAGEQMSAEDDAAWTRALDDVDRIGEQIANLERTAALDSQFRAIDENTVHVGADGAAAPDAESNYRSAFERFVRHGLGELEVEERALLRANFGPVGEEQRAQGTTSGGAGGYTVPQGFWAKVTETMKYFGGAADGAESLTTDSGNAIPWPTNDDTANVGYQLGENTQATNEGDLAFGQKQLGAYTYVSGPILVSFQLLQDSGVDIEAFIARKMGERIGRIENTRFTTGTGSSQPQGYITGATTGKTTSGATAITLNEIIDLIHSVDAAYRATGRCRFKMHDLVLAYVRKIRDDSGGAGLGRPIWEPSVQAGVPDLLLGYPYSINNDMASTVATTNKTIAFGDFTSAFVVRKVNGGRMMRLEERYADYLQVGFIGYERADALVQDASAVKLLVQA
jgi:HK97 family phage major capsid protein